MEYVCVMISPNRILRVSPVSSQETTTVPSSASSACASDGCSTGSTVSTEMWLDSAAYSSIRRWMRVSSVSGWATIVMVTSRSSSAIAVRVVSPISKRLLLVMSSMRVLVGSEPTNRLTTIKIASTNAVRPAL